MPRIRVWLHIAPVDAHVCTRVDWSTCVASIYIWIDIDVHDVLRARTVYLHECSFPGRARTRTRVRTRVCGRPPAWTGAGLIDHA